MDSLSGALRWVIRCALLCTLCFGAGCAGQGRTDSAGSPAGEAPSAPEAGETMTPTPEPITLTIWHRWPADQAATVRDIVGDYQVSRPYLTVDLVHQADMSAALRQASAGDARPDILALAGDRIAEAVAASAITPMDVFVDASWLEESFLSTAVDALRYQGKLWGLPFSVQAITFIYNTSIIRGEELAAQTSELIEKAQQFQSTHEGVWYLAYPARNDVYFAAPWFYGAGAWYADEAGNVGLNTPAGLEAARFIASLRSIMPAEIGHTEADKLFKSGKAAITINGPWYIEELRAAGVPFGLQIMPIVSSSGQPARPLVTTDGLMLAANQRHVEEAVKLIAYLAGAESELQMARKHGLIPANRIAIDRAGQEGLVVISHFAQQAAFGAPMPASPAMSATWEPITTLMEALWNGEDAQVALEEAQKAAEKSAQRARR